MTKPTCKTCRFHVPALAGDFLECHRDTPPWSKVFKGSWCAQHEPEDPASGPDDNTQILEIGGRLRADPYDHCTADPMFCLQILVRDSGYDYRYAGNKCWWNAELMECVYDDDSEDRKRDCWFDPDDDAWEGPFGYKDRWATVRVAFSQAGIDDYMRLDGHNVKRQAFRGQTRTYVESFRRCDEMVAVREYLKTLPVVPEKKTTDDKPEDPYDFKGYWRHTMEGAPRDGGRMLAIVDGEVTIVHRVRGNDEWLNALTGEACQPTNWMPLPPRPRKINDKPKP